MNETNLTGAGILPIIKKNEINQNKLVTNYYVILYYEKFKKKYEDLGGGIDKKDKNIFNTASRESYEESATYLNIDVNTLKKCKYVRIKNYVCFIVQINNFDINKGMNMLKQYKNIKHYNEMNNIKIINIKDIINEKTSLPLSNRLIEVIKGIKNVKTNKI